MPRHLLHAVAAVGGSDADSRGHGHRPGGECERLTERRHGSLGESVCLGGITKVVDEQGELVSADPRGDIGLPGHRRQPARERGEQLVSDRVPERVVDILEIVQVDEQDRGDRPVPSGQRQRMPGAVGEQDPVRQFGQRIVEGTVVQFVLQAPLLRDVAERQHPALDARPGAQVAAPDPYAHDLPVVAGDPPLFAEIALPAVGGARTRTPWAPFHVGGGCQPAYVGAYDGHVAVDGSGGRRSVANGVVIVDDQDGVGRVLYQFLEQLLALALDALSGEQYPLHGQAGLADQDPHGRPPDFQVPLTADQRENAGRRLARRIGAEEDRAQEGSVTA